MKSLVQLQTFENLGNLEEIKQVQDEIEDLLEMEDIRWKQRAKRNWFQYEDRNTKFFHAWANQRRRQNHISEIQYEEVARWTKHEDIGGAFTMFFQNLFTSEGSVSLEECMAMVTPRVTPE